MRWRIATEPFVQTRFRHFCLLDRFVEVSHHVYRWFIPSVGEHMTRPLVRQNGPLGFHASSGQHRHADRWLPIAGPVRSRTLTEAAVLSSARARSLAPQRMKNTTSTEGVASQMEMNGG